MSTFRSRRHNLGQEVAKDKIGVFEEMVQKVGVKVIWSGFALKSRAWALVAILMSSQMACLKLKLGMMAKAAGVKADKLEGSIERRIQEALNG